MGGHTYVLIVKIQDKQWYIQAISVINDIQYLEGMVELLSGPVDSVIYKLNIIMLKKIMLNQIIDQTKDIQTTLKHRNTTSNVESLTMSSLARFKGRLLGLGLEVAESKTVPVDVDEEEVEARFTCSFCVMKQAGNKWWEGGACSGKAGHKV